MRLLVESSKGLYRMLDESLYTAQLGAAFQKETHKELARHLSPRGKPWMGFTVT